MTLTFLLHEFGDITLQNMKTKLFSQEKKCLMKRLSDLSIRLLWSNLFLKSLCRFLKWINLLNSSRKKDKELALFAVKCVQEIPDDSIIKVAAKKLDGRGESGPRGFYLACNHISDQGVHDLCKLLRNMRIQELNIASNFITDDGIAKLCDVLVENKSSLRHLDVSRNRFTDEGLRLLCEALKHKNCGLVSLVLRVFGDHDSNKKGLSPESRKYICNALKHKNCKLVSLNVLWSSFESSNKIEEEFEDISDLCNALRHENCKLEWLNLGYHGSYDGRREQLERASRVEGFLTLRPHYGYLPSKVKIKRE